MAAMGGEAGGGPAWIEVLTRKPGAGAPESNYEKVVVLPEIEDRKHVSGATTPRTHLG